MTKRKPPKVRWESWTERQIREAKEEGHFDNLPGMGEPIPSLDEPYDESRWMREKLRREKLSALPPALEIRRVVEQELQQIWQMQNEVEVRRAIEALNQRIRDANLNTTWGPPTTTMPFDVEKTIERWKQQQLSNS